MPKVRVHPIQLKYAHAHGKQTCELCGAEERWGVEQQPTVQGKAYDRSLHLIHLVREHLAEVQASFATSERTKEVIVTEDDKDNNDADEDESPAE